MLDILEKGISEKAFKTFLKDQPEWLKEYKNNAWETFNNLSTKKEKFVDVIDSLELENKSLVNGLKEPVDADKYNSRWGEVSAYFSMNGSNNLSETLKNKGVILKSLKSAIIENEDLVKPYLLKSNITSKDSKFTALAEAMWVDGIFLYVPEDVNVDLPMHFLKWTDIGANQNFYKTLVVVEKNSKLTVIDEFGSENTNDFFLVSGINEIHIKDNSNVTYLHLQNFDYNAFNFSLQKSVIGKDAKLVNLSVSIGSQFSYENIRTYMENEGGHSEILGLVIGEKEQVFQHETLQYHPVANATSNFHFEVMLKDKSESAHNGFVQIEKAAQKTDARQLIRNLLLSRKAKAEAIPNLEILADDVKCAHGVSLGPVNPEELFYLTSRGFTQEEAENFIIEGHIENVLVALADKIDDEDEEETDSIENYFQENVTLLSRTRDFVLSALEKKGK